MISHATQQNKGQSETNYIRFLYQFFFKFSIFSPYFIFSVTKLVPDFGINHKSCITFDAIAIVALLATTLTRTMLSCFKRISTLLVGYWRRCVIRVIGTQLVGLHLCLPLHHIFYFILLFILHWIFWSKKNRRLLNRSNIFLLLSILTFMEPFWLWNINTCNEYFLSVL